MISVYIFTQFHKLLNDKFATDKCGACSGSPQSVKGIPCTHIYTYMYTCTSTVPQQLPMPHPQQFTTVNVRPLFTFIQNSLKFILVHTSAETSSTTLAMKQQKGIGIQRLTYRLYTAKSVAKMHASTIRMTPLYL